MNIFKWFENKDSGVKTVNYKEPAKQLFNFYDWIQEGNIRKRVRCEFPTGFSYSFQSEKQLIQDFSIEEYIDEIMIINKSDYASATFTIDDNKIKITISLPAIKVGIGNNLNIINFDSTYLKKSFTHELYHAKHIVDIYIKYGIEEVSKIERLTNDKRPEQLWTRVAWLTFDEYCVRRENAKNYQDTDSCYDYYNISNQLKYIHYDIKTSKENFEIMNNLFYNLSVLVALEDEGEHFDRANMNQIADDTKNCFNKYYNHMPISFRDYEAIGLQLEQII